MGHGRRLFWPQQRCSQLQPAAQAPEPGKLQDSLPLRLKVRLRTLTLTSEKIADEHFTALWMAATSQT